MTRPWLSRLGRFKERAKVPFVVEFWDGERLANGPEEDAAFRVYVANKPGERALKSLDEIRISESYMSGDIELEGEILKLFDLRRALSDHHPFLDHARRVKTRIIGEVRDNRKAIGRHYEYDDDFYMTFLDETRTYSHGVYESDEETLETAMRRKLDYAIEACGLQAGMRVLDVGGGWGAFTEYAGRQGIRVTSLTISESSYRYLEELIGERQLPCRVVMEDFLTHVADERYDAIVILGVIEHMPNYRRVVEQLEKLARNGGRIYMDGSASTNKYDFNLFLNRYIYPGNHCCLSLHDFMAEVQASGLELLALHNDRYSYYLTALGWVRKLEAHRAEIIQRWGRALYCRFHLYLWGVCHNFLTNQLQAYRLVLAVNPPR